MPKGNPKIEMQKFNELFYLQKLPAKEVASFFKVGVSAIGSFRKRHNLKGRGWSKPPWLGKKRDKRTIAILAQKARERKGPLNPTWKGGKYKTFAGYIRILKPNHPHGDKGYVLEHRFVMEKKLRRLISRDEIVHHINGVKTDNRIENLCLHTRSSHGKKHYPKGSKFGIHKSRNIGIKSCRSRYA